jgi:hypothetical protein
MVGSPYSLTDRRLGFGETQEECASVKGTSLETNFVAFSFFFLRTCRSFSGSERRGRPSTGLFFFRLDCLSGRGKGGIVGSRREPLSTFDVRTRMWRKGFFFYRQREGREHTNSAFYPGPTWPVVSWLSLFEAGIHTPIHFSWRTPFFPFSLGGLARPLTIYNTSGWRAAADTEHFEGKYHLGLRLEPGPNWDRRGNGTGMERIAEKGPDNHQRGTRATCMGRAGTMTIPMDVGWWMYMGSEHTPSLGVYCFSLSFDASRRQETVCL